jgi:hypothetical protein
MRVTISLPDDLLSDLDFVASRFKITRSGVVSGLLSEVVPSVRAIVGLMPPPGSDVTEADVKRFRGASADLISKQLAQLLLGEVQNDLFSK